MARKNKKRKRSNFTPEYEAEVVEPIRTSGKSGGAPGVYHRDRE